METTPPSINGTSTHLVPPTPPETIQVSQSQSQVPLDRLNPGHTPSSIAAQPKVRDVRISPDGRLILYQITQFYRSGDRTISTLWLAETNKPSSAIPVTSGEFNDRSGVFHPDGQRILFLSDRQTPGKGSLVYSLSLGHIIRTKLTLGDDDQRSYHRGDDTDVRNFVNANGNNNIVTQEEAPTKSDSVDEVIDCFKQWNHSAIPEPTILTSKFSKKGKGIQGFEISPSGNLLAFTSPDPPSPSSSSSSTSDAIIIGAKSNLLKLRVYNFATDTIRTLSSAGKDKQIEGFTWSADSKEILYRLRQNRGTEWSEFEVTLESISVVEGSEEFGEGREGDVEPKSLGSYPRSPSGSNIWLSTNHILSLQNYQPQNILDARTLHVHHTATRSSSRLYGLTNDAVRILPVRTPSTAIQGINRDFVAVEVSSDTSSSIDIVTFSPESATYERKFTLFQTSSDAIWFNSWDAKRLVDPSDPSLITYIFAAVLSSGPRHEPPNVYSGSITARLTANGTESPVNGGVLPLSRSNDNLVLLSNHLKWLSSAPVLPTRVIRWKSRDGVELSGLVRFPPGYDPDSSTPTRLPTILFIHGGPYRRDIPDYMPYYCNWRELLASSGYLTISPNYRGSQGRGHAFAHTSTLSGIGTSRDWDDCDSMVDEVVKLGWGDKDKLGVAGWSHGGSLTAWGVAQTKTRYRAAIVGAGATNWEGMVMESASPELEAAISNSSPWPTSPSSSAEPKFTTHSLRKSSPIHNIPGISTSILILHGQLDERVPLGQALGFYRGLRRCAAPRGRDTAQLVVYPREPHGFVERKHAQDVMERVLVHFATYI
ncbi:hypothetical protein NP233_g5226 [Leucocoprinus birnbaumii]|uniref:Dipeptidyl-peptidase V n=1 Tax=Leucocoprinus birnbaumii TaxID=56174 RepID=A0AAD5VVL0_9AGAR|nr:hypothetical protein NP233_g5226 [Leucocoprinus birnbaumii]